MLSILIVEDSPIFGSLVKKSIEQQLECSAILTESFAEAKKIFDQHGDTIDVALLDLNLPDAEMGEVVDYAVAKGIASIVFTSRFDIKLHQKIWSKGVVDYVLKDGPDSLNYIVSQIRRLQRNHLYKVMVVDDSPVICKLITRLLKIHRFDVITAENGKKALELLDQHPDTQLILTDYNMPEMDGFDLTRTLRRSHTQTNLSIIGLSAQGDRHISSKFIKHGANDFIAKPFYAEEFYCRINQSIDTLERIKIIQESSYRDFLTGLYNRRYFFERATVLFKQHQQICVAMIDIDFFKKVNDTYGHDVGDIALKHVASTLLDSLSQAYLVARFGGEEFCVLMPGLTPQQAEQQLNDVRIAIEKISIPLKNDTFSVTVSIGICTNKEDTIDAMITIADQQLYRAKQQGRNCICL
ncbi:MAG: diguanylate cyclase [Deltaproteobacteria bacterium]|nr:diguanylate cyclase [Deltaproteobacteria bacterium]